MQVTATPRLSWQSSIENALVLLTRFFCAVARRWYLGDLSMQVRLTVNNFWRPLRMIAAKSMVALLCRMPLPQRDNVPGRG